MSSFPPRKAPRDVNRTLPLHTLLLVLPVVLATPSTLLAGQAPLSRGQVDDAAAAVATPEGRTSAPDLELTAEEEALDPGGKKLAATPTDSPPVIDGRVDDHVWELAEVVTDFLQREPREGAPASEKTEVRILYDERAIYLSFVLHDSNPAGIIASDLRRDSRLNTDDTIAVFFDTFHDHRNGFLFRVNPLGTKYDATVKDESDVNSQWDERWEAAARITERGWEAEMEIPWNVLRFRAGSHVWGIDFKREIRRKNEEANWSNYRRGFDFRAVSQMGHMIGLRDLELTGRYRLKPYVSGGYTALNATDTPFREGAGEFGIEDFKYQITPNLTADLTINTDFAQVEDDQERVNLSRFPLFFPERREFFLEGSDKFSFGGGGGHGPPLATLFHSRNIGLVSGTPVPMTYGAKIAGKMGDTSVGFINAQTGSEAAAGHDGGNYSVLRLRQDVFARSSVGLIATNVQSGGEFNRVAGVDANFRFFDHLQVNGYAARSNDSRPSGNGWIGAFGASWDDDLLSFGVDYNYIDDDFRTDLGFILRSDILRQNYRVGIKPRPSLSWVRQVMTFVNVTYVADTGGDIESREQNIYNRVQFESGDSMTVSFARNFERIEYPFSVSGAATILPGDYSFNEWRVSLDSYDARPLSARVSVSGGGFFDGTRRSYGGGGTVRLNEKASISPGYSFNRIELPTDAFNTHVITMRGAYSFSENVLTSALVQYNSIADRLSVFARLNYIYRTGDDVFLVFKSTTRWDEGFYGESDRAVVAKMTRSFEF